MSTFIMIVTGCVVALFGACQLRIVAVMLARRAPPPATAADVRDLPLVAIQIATYREAATVGALLEAVGRLDWPRDRLWVHILDDSPPGDAARIDAIVAEHARRGLPVRCCRRGTRVGFKAGALNHGLQAAAGADYIAYFDADCRPHPQFLRRLVPRFADPAVAAVQARWRFPNARRSPLTMLQAAAFEFLFADDLPVRAAAGLSAYYFGSAAVWRRSVPIALGGWRFDPFTAEDVDMGLRAANAGWTVAYEPAVLADDDAVEDILAFRTQQRRWAQAVLQAGASAIGALPWHARRPWARLVDWTSFCPHALIPLTPLMTLCVAAWVLTGIPSAPGLFLAISVMMLASPATIAITLAQRRLHPDDWRDRVLLLLRAGPCLAAAMGSFLLGLVDSLRPGKLEFVSTPKQGRTGVIAGHGAPWLRAQVVPVLVDTCLAGLFGAAVLAACRDGAASALLPLFIMTLQFTASAVLTGRALVRQTRRAASKRLAV